MGIPFIVSDESVNRFGFRVLTAGIDTTAFEKNPVMLWNHLRDDEWLNNSAQNLPIGRWEDLRIEGGNLIADAVFDENDELALRIKAKVEQGIISSASIGFSVLAMSEAPEDIIEGQTRGTVTKSELHEISVVDIPGNSNAVKLKSKRAVLSLNAQIDLNKLNNSLPMIKLGATLGGNLDELIEAYAESQDITKGEAQDIIGEAGGISGSTVGQIVAGEINCPPLSRLTGFAEVLPVSRAQLITWAESDGCSYDEQQKLKFMSEDNKTLSQKINEGVTTAMQSFMDKLKANFTLTAKEGTKQDVNELVTDLTASIGAIELSMETPEADNTAMETLTASMQEMNETLAALKTTNDEMAEELVQLKGAGSQKKPATDKKSLANNKVEATEEESAELQSLGLAFKKHYNR